MNVSGFNERKPLHRNFELLERDKPRHRTEDLMDMRGENRDVAKRMDAFERKHA